MNIFYFLFLFSVICVWLSLLTSLDFRNKQTIPKQLRQKFDLRSNRENVKKIQMILIRTISWMFQTIRLTTAIHFSRGLPTSMLEDCEVFLLYTIHFLPRQDDDVVQTTTIWAGIHVPRSPRSDLVRGFFNYFVSWSDPKFDHSSWSWCGPDLFWPVDPCIQEAFYIVFLNQEIHTIYLQFS